MRIDDSPGAGTTFRVVVTDNESTPDFAAAMGDGV
jgi:hypothetical protein